MTWHWSRAVLQHQLLTDSLSTALSCSLGLSCQYDHSFLNDSTPDFSLACSLCSGCCHSFVRLLSWCQSIFFIVFFEFLSFQFLCVTPRSGVCCRSCILLTCPSRCSHVCVSFLQTTCTSVIMWLNSCLYAHCPRSFFFRLYLYHIAFLASSFQCKKVIIGRLLLRLSKALIAFNRWLYVILKGRAFMLYIFVANCMGQASASFTC